MLHTRVLTHQGELLKEKYCFWESKTNNLAKLCAWQNVEAHFMQILNNTQTFIKVSHSTLCNQSASSHSFFSNLKNPQVHELMTHRLPVFPSQHIVCKTSPSLLLYFSTRSPVQFPQTAMTWYVLLQCRCTDLEETTTVETGKCRIWERWGHRGGERSLFAVNSNHPAIKQGHWASASTTHFLAFDICSEETFTLNQSCVLFEGAGKNPAGEDYFLTKRLLKNFKTT